MSLIRYHPRYSKGMFNHCVIKDGVIRKHVYHFDSKFHRVGGPAVHQWNSKGQLIWEQWLVDESYHREDGPAFRRWNSKGQLIIEEWCLNGQYNREDGPALRVWNDEGVLIEEIWHRHNDRHREDGPALREWNDEGQLIFEEWWVDGKLVDKPSGCDGKVVTIEGKQYRLEPV